MKSNFMLSIMLLVGLTFTACLSMYPERTSSDESLLVIPTEFIKAPGADHARSYFLGFSNGEEKKISSKRYSKIYVKLSSDDDRINMITSRVTNPDFRGDPSSREVDIELPYEAGRVVIYDFTIVQEIEQIKSGSYQSGYDFIELTDDDKKAIYDELRDNPEFSTWFE